MKNLLFIYNPHSGKGLIKDNLAEIINIFIKGGYEVTVYPTQRRNDAKEKVKYSGYNYDMIVCSGGDGTLNEVISGLMDLPVKPVLGYIPAGSTNDFAQSIKLSKEMDESARAAMNGLPILVDIGSFNKKYFVYIAAFGLFTDISYATPQEMKNALGHQAYLIEAATKIPNLKTYNMKAEYDGGKIEGEFIYGMISNSISVGGIKGITGKNIVLDDGLFEVRLVKKPKNPLDFSAVFGNLLGVDIKIDSVVSFKTSKLKIESDEKVSWVLDGEFGGALKKVKIVNHKQAVKIMSGISKG